MSVFVLTAHCTAEAENMPGFCGSPVGSGVAPCSRASACTWRERSAGLPNPPALASDRHPDLWTGLSEYQRSAGTQKEMHHFSTKCILHYNGQVKSHTNKCDEWLNGLFKSIACLRNSIWFNAVTNKREVLFTGNEQWNTNKFSFCLQGFKKKLVQLLVCRWNTIILDM